MATEKNGQEAMDANSAGLDTNLYSRQMYDLCPLWSAYYDDVSFFRYALGESAMIHLRKASVVISGLGGVGVEVAKNLVLGGIFIPALPYFQQFFFLFVKL